MAAITIYTTMLCPYCAHAKDLLNSKGVAYTEIDVTFDPPRRQEMIELSNGRTSVPQIFIDQRPIGGCDDLFELDKSGKLDAVLEEQSDQLSVQES